ncbi:MAG: hypothetical protein M1837_005150 [Sclerophora amabilis]|nr:MAG: hypothetical protein M1837_005150 [Sclerophora amabilis]
MSWKGFSKSVVRTPQTVKQRFNVGETTKDAVYIDAERRFQELETETKKLHAESKKFVFSESAIDEFLLTRRRYFEAITGMLNHQIEFSKAVAEIYRPISGRLSDPDAIEPEGNPEGIRACEEYENIVRDLLATLQPELEMIETRVIRPANELLEVIKVIRKTLLKRQHKQLDYDRRRATFKKLQDKKDKNLKDEKAMYKAENEVEQATQDFNYFNDLLKEELPRLFQLEREFIRPLFQSFYYMQLNVFYTLHEKMQGVNIGYFDLTLGIEEAFEAKRGDIQSQAETLAITKYKTTGGRRHGPGSSNVGRLGGPQRPLAIEAGPGGKGGRSRSSSNPPTRPAIDNDITSPPPPYSPQPSNDSKKDNSVIGRANSTGSSWGAAAKSKGAAPPPPKPKPSRLSGAPSVPVAVETATALYDYEAQAEGDLSFSAGDVIELVQKGATGNEWWRGKAGGKEGSFPGNYVQLN